MQGRWIKSHKAVEFPFKDLDLTKYLAEVPRKTAEMGQGNASAEDEGEDDSLHPLQDFHQHRITEGANPFHLSYRLYAIVVRETFQKTDLIELIIVYFKCNMNFNSATMESWVVAII
jgi:hypothetical protein